MSTTTTASGFNYTTCSTADYSCNDAVPAQQQHITVEVKDNSVKNAVYLLTAAVAAALCYNVVTTTFTHPGTPDKRTGKTTMSLAPVAAFDLKEQSANEYIEKFAYLAKSEYKRTGIPASITLAQALVESNAGCSTLARETNNHFGMKCFSRKCKKGHCINRTDDTHKDFFRKYDSVTASYRAHSDLLRSKFRVSGTAFEIAEQLQKQGYATDKRYAEKLKNTIERFNLTRFDK